MSYIVELHRAFSSPTVRFGPFDDVDSAADFCTIALKGHGAIVPVVDPDDFTDTPDFWLYAGTRF